MTELEKNVSVFKCPLKKFREIILSQSTVSKAVFSFLAKQRVVFFFFGNIKTFLMQSGFWYFNTKRSFFYILKIIIFFFLVRVFVQLIHLSMVSRLHFWYKGDFFVISSLIIFFLQYYQTVLVQGIVHRSTLKCYSRPAIYKNTHTQNVFFSFKTLLFLNYCDFFSYYNSNVFSNYVALQSFFFICFCHCDNDLPLLTFHFCYSGVDAKRSFLDVSCQAQYRYIPPCF